MIRTASIAVLLSVTLGVALIGCGGSKKSSQAGATAAASSQTTTPPAPLFSQQIQPIFDSNCTVCHTPGGSASLSLRAGESYASTVNRPALQAPHLNLIQPGSSEQSYLFRKLTSTHLDAGGTGEPMPQGFPPLVDAEIDLIRRWIDAGAAND